MERIAKEDRKITSDKFTITLPKDWRDVHGLTPKMALTPFYSDGSPLILIPKGMPLDDLEIKLITLIINYRGVKDTQKLAEDLGDVVDKLNEGLQA